MMDRLCLLVRVPALPFDFEMLRPSGLLAQLAGDLGELGIVARILDVGTLEAFDTFCAARTHPTACCPAEKLGQILSSTLSGESQECVVAYWVQGKSELRAAGICANAMRAEYPGLIQCVVSDKIVHPPRGIECSIAGNQARGLARLCRISSIHSIDGIPNLTVRRSRWLRETSTIPEYPVAAQPVYCANVYPSLSFRTKLKLFDIGTDVSHNTVAFASGIEGKGPTISAIVDEASRLRRLHSARGFMIRGGSRAKCIPESLASAFARRGLALCLGMDSLPASVPPSSRAQLRLAGFGVFSLEVRSGSQRLLDEVYGAGTGVSEMEGGLAAIHEMGALAVLRLDFPTPWDDYHTEAETLRFIQRTNPAAVEIRQRMNGRRARKAFARFEGAVRALGVATDISPPELLAARMAGAAGREREFIAHFRRALRSGDAVGVADAVEQINRAGGLVEEARQPGGVYRHVVGN